MALRIEDYALIGDCETAALVGKDGSIDWLCLPRFDSGACFAALLGTQEQGRWLIAPQGEVRHSSRRYRGDTLILETTFETDEGVVTLVDCMPFRDETPSVVRVVRGVRGRVPMRMHLVIRFDYGSIVPWVRHANGGIRAVAGPDTLSLHSPVETHGENLTTVAEFDVAEGQELPFVLGWQESHREDVQPLDAGQAVRGAEEWWHDWAGRCHYDGPWRDQITRSLLTLKAMTYAPTGGIVAAPTTSLPEQIGGVRNWDYRFCWLRDATFTLMALMNAGFLDEARAWRSWLLRAAAGTPSSLQIMYGIAGERRLTEWEVPWLAGYENSCPVRIGNAASEQFQLDVYGEVIDALFQARKAGMKETKWEWNLERALLQFLETAWERPDDGIWEMRGPRRHFTHSKVMAWVAFDRGIKSIEQFGLDGPIARWREVRQRIFEQVCRDGFDAGLNAFVQYYGSQHLDASLLMVALVGFLPAEDPRVRGTVAAIEQHLMNDGFVARYNTESNVDRLPPGEGAFLPCTCWLLDNWVLQGRHDEAAKRFEKLLALCNDVGLVSEEYDPQKGRLLGNFPQAFTHVGLVNTAHNLFSAQRPAENRKQA